MLRQIANIGGLTLVSRVIGFIRDVATAAILGAGPIADAFFVAFRLPNHFRSLFAEGAFNAAFVPVFSGVLVQKGREEAKAFAEMLFTLMIIVQVALLVLFWLIMPAFMLVFAPGFSDDPAKFDLAVTFTRITFPYLLCITLVSLIGGVLNSLERFSAAAAAPILMNLVLLASLFWLRPFVPNAGYALAWGVLLSGIAQLAYLYWDSRRCGMALRFRRPRLTPEARRFWRVLGPAAMGRGLTQISLFADTLIASMLPTGAVSYLYYADRLNQLPLGVIGIAVGTALLPQLSRQLKSGQLEAARGSQNRAIEITLVLTLPAVAAFLVISLPLLDLLFRRGAFDMADAQATAAVLRAYGAGLPAFVLVPAMVSGFYAREDARTPLYVSLVAVTINVILKIVLTQPWGAMGIAASTSISAWINVGLLALLQYRRGFFVPDRAFIRRVPQALLAALVLAVFLLFADRWLLDSLDEGRWQEAVAVAAVILASALIYGGLAVLFGLIDLRALRDRLRARRGRRA